MNKRLNAAMKLILLTLSIVWSALAQAHHFVTDVYDPERIATYEVTVTEFLFVNPHPFVKVTLVGSNEHWTLEMDNRWELAELGFDKNTLQAGDILSVSVNPNPYNAKAFYIRAMEHPAQGFRYEHNVRQLFKLEGVCPHDDC